jgi:AcrR family transcriptional regulator
VDAAESLFVEGGEAATSLRAVARRAHANAAAVHYHFGGRDELLRAVFERYFGPLARQRLQRLDELADRGRPDRGDPELRGTAEVEAIVEAIVRPDLELLAKLRRRRMEIARFLGQGGANPGIETVLRGDAEALGARALPLLARVLPELPPAELAARLILVRATIAALFAEAGAAPPLGLTHVDDQVRRLVTFAAAGLAAPAPAGQRNRHKRRKDRGEGRTLG